MFRFFTVVLALCIGACSSEAIKDPVPNIVIDQFGYLPELQKRAIIRSPEIGYDAGKPFEPSERYAVMDIAKGEVIFEGSPEVWGEGRIDDMSGDRVWWFDFSAVTAEVRDEWLWGNVM